MQMALSHN